MSVNFRKEYFGGIGWNNFPIIRWPGFGSWVSFQLRQEYFIERSNILSLTTILPTLALPPFVSSEVQMLPHAKFYLIVQTSWQGFCFQLVSPSDPSLIVGLLILAPLPSPTWRKDNWIFAATPQFHHDHKHHQHHHPPNHDNFTWQYLAAPLCLCQPPQPGKPAPQCKSSPREASWCNC